MLACCGAEGHEWDRLEVDPRWLPRELRCFNRDSRFFLSEYLSWRTEAKASDFARAFKRFTQERMVF